MGLTEQKAVVQPQLPIIHTLVFPCVINDFLNYEAFLISCYHVIVILVCVNWCFKFLMYDLFKMLTLGQLNYISEWICGILNYIAIVIIIKIIIIVIFFWAEMLTITS